MDYSRYEKLRALVRGSFSSETQRLVDEALAYADERLAGMTRYDGSPLLEHGAGVACIVISEIGLGRNSTLSSILHDVVRIAHKQQTQEEFLALMSDLRARFGEQVAGITMGLCNISELKLKVANEQAGNFRDLIVSYSEDPRVILIKLADRLEVMRSLDIFPREKWRKKSWESMNLYAQIAHKLGLYGLKSELEDIALKYLEPKDYEHIVAKLEESADERRAFIARFIVPIEERLQKLGIRYHIKSRTKSIFSIWNKMQKQRVPFEGVYDIFAIRIIIDCPLEDEKRLCWTVYSIVTDFYTPNPNRMRDWISIPKSNGYESLHTTVSAEGRWVEVQIRTERMDAVAERGIAAHWRYKGVGQGAATSEQWLSRLRELMEDTPHALAQRFDAKPATGEIFVFTPNGDLRKLPEGATLLDFAFDIHTNLGATCSGGKVNNCSTTATSSRFSPRRTRRPRPTGSRWWSPRRRATKSSPSCARSRPSMPAWDARSSNASSRTGNSRSRWTRRWPTWPNISRCGPAPRSTASLRRRRSTWPPSRRFSRATSRVRPRRSGAPRRPRSNVRRPQRARRSPHGAAMR